MLQAVVGTLIYLIIKLEDIIPSLGKVWYVLEIRVLVLISLALQIFLIYFGKRRKYVANRWLQPLVWLAYLSANWVATFVLGILSCDSKNPAKNNNLKNTPKTEEKNSNFIIMATWAPFLLVHLGGPDTITAYSLEDNELWKRHLLDLLSQLIATFNVIRGSWNDTHLHYVYILVVVVGIIKYGERTWSLRSGSSQVFRESILPPPDPGPNYAKFMDDYTAKEAEGYEVSVKEVIETPAIVLGPSEGANEGANAASLLRDGFYFFKIFECLFADLILSFQDHKNSQNFFQNITWNYAFQVIEAELALMYDMLYTKAVLTYSRLGFFLKFVSVLCTLSAFITFYFLIHKAHIDGDHVITLVLFGGAIYLEIHAFIVLLSSSWAMHWFSKHKNKKVNSILYKSISWFKRVCKLSHTNRWSNSVSKFNLLSYCLKDKSIKCIQIRKPLHIYQLFEKSYYKRTAVPPELKEFIFKQLKVKSKEASSIEACKQLCNHRGDRVLANRSCCDIDWSVKVEFDQSILLWHIATDLCYYSDVNDKSNCGQLLESCKTRSQLLSDYMLYLLVMCPFMLPNGIGQIRFQDTCAELDELLKERRYISEKSKVCEVLLRVNTEVPPLKVKGDRSKSVLFDACILAKSLQSLEMKKNDKWEMILDVWVEILCYAACHCRGLDHAKQLSEGGELLTHVWLLMAHLGITEQFQISQGHARAKLLLS